MCVPSTAEILAQANACHTAGDLVNAERLCRCVLLTDAANVEAWHLLGIVYQRLGKPEESVACLMRVIRMKPDFAEAHGRLGELLAAHGKLDEAILCFEQACRLRPESIEMSNRLRHALAVRSNRSGNELAARGDLDQAAACYRRALELKPEIAASHNNLGTVLAEQGKPHEAVDSFRKALELNSDFAEAHNNLGAELAKLGLRDEAAACFRRALALKPDYAKAHHNMAALWAEHGQLDEAAACCRRALQLEPDLADAHITLALVLQQQDMLKEAVACCRRALEFKPDCAEAHGNLGVMLSQQERLDDAAGHYRRALELKPGATDIYVNLGALLTQQENLLEAAACFRRALELNPDLSSAYYNLAVVLTKQERFDEAAACYARVLELEPDYAEAHYNLGVVLRDQGKLAEAAACLRRAVELKPDYADAHHGYAFVLLLMARFAEGWREYEWRWKLKGYSEPAYSQPRWTGSGLAGRTILLHAEAGAGDALQFIRYAELVKQQDRTVIVECGQELSRLIATCPGVDRVVVAGESLPEFDSYIPLLSLPGIFGTSLENIPAKVPYLRPSPLLVERWKNELGHHRELKVGIAWQGNPNHLADRFRSLPLSRFARIARIPGVRLYSLQVGAGREQMAQPAGSQMAVTDLGDRLGDFYSTAAVVFNMDLVISCDSSAAHLAGALGVPVWVALAFSPDWRWMRDRTDSPWYPTMRLFRQPKHRDWDSVFWTMEEALANMVKSRMPLV